VFAGTNRQSAAMPTDDEKAAVEAAASLAKTKLPKMQAQLKKREKWTADQRDELRHTRLLISSARRRCPLGGRPKLKTRTRSAARSRNWKVNNRGQPVRAIVSEADETPKAFCSCAATAQPQR